MDEDDLDIEIVNASNQLKLLRVRIGIGVDMGEDPVPNFVIMGMTSRDNEGNETEVIYGMSRTAFMSVFETMLNFILETEPTSD